MFRKMFNVKILNDINKKKYIHVCRSIILRCNAAVRKNINPYVSFEDLHLPFQDFHCMDLREKGWLVLGTDKDGNPGVALDRKYRGFDATQLMDWMREHLGRE